MDFLFLFFWACVACLFTLSLCRLRDIRAQRVNIDRSWLLQGYRGGRWHDLCKYNYVTQYNVDSDYDGFVKNVTDYTNYRVLIIEKRVKDIWKEQD